MAYKDPFPQTDITGDDIRDTLGISQKDESLLFVLAKSGGLLLPDDTSDPTAISLRRKTAVYLPGVDGATEANYGRLIRGAVPYFNPFCEHAPVVWEEFDDGTVDMETGQAAPPVLRCKLRDDVSPWQPDRPYAFIGDWRGYSHGAMPEVRDARVTRKGTTNRFTCVIDSAEFKGAGSFLRMGVRLSQTRQFVTSDGVELVETEVGEYVASTSIADTSRHTIDVSGFRLPSVTPAANVNIALIIRNTRRNTNVDLPHYAKKFSTQLYTEPADPTISTFKVFSKKDNAYVVPAAVLHSSSLSPDGSFTIVFSVSNAASLAYFGDVWAGASSYTLEKQDIIANMTPDSTTGLASITRRTLTGKLNFPVAYGTSIWLEIRA